ncbi:hypothetical protein CPB85DRAFT_742909 [Mucidula mucida]|nr:hypothetical protein CPB85DRAFT_742909 [Mucidula mucida]
MLYLFGRTKVLLLLLWTGPQTEPRSIREVAAEDGSGTRTASRIDLTYGSMQATSHSPFLKHGTLCSSNCVPELSLSFPAQRTSEVSTAPQTIPYAYLVTNDLGFCPNDLLLEAESRSKSSCYLEEMRHRQDDVVIIHLSDGLVLDI